MLVFGNEKLGFGIGPDHKKVDPDPVLLTRILNSANCTVDCGALSGASLKKNVSPKRMKSAAMCYVRVLGNTPVTSI